jgi:excisionase family DNA binding protein
MENQGKLLLRGQEVAEALNISRALAYRWMAAGILPVVRVPGGRSIRVPQQALLRWIEINTAGAGDHTKSTDGQAPETTNHSDWDGHDGMFPPSRNSPRKLSRTPNRRTQARRRAAKDR